MKKYLLNSPNQSEDSQFSHFAEMVLNEALIKYRKDKLRQEIDETLRNRNKKEFMRLTEELKSIS